MNYLPVTVRCDPSLTGHYANVLIERILEESLYGTVLADPAL